MSDYPCLTDMGIRNPQQITGYVVNSINRIDVLRITYKRDKGALLPSSQSFEFPRVQADGTPDKDKGTILNTDPFLKKVAKELDQLLLTKKRKQSVAESLREELQALEEEMTMRLNHIRETLDALDNP